MFKIRTTHFRETPNDQGVKRPDFVPEKFWSPELAPALAAAPEPLKKVFQSYAELETAHGKQAQELEPALRKKIETERFAKRPAKPEDYALPELKDVKLPPGVTVKLIGDHPMMKTWRGMAHAQGLDQAGFDAGIKAFVEAEGSTMAGVDGEMKLLGEGEAATQRVKRVDAFISEHLDDDGDYTALVDMLRTSKQVVAFEKLMKKLGKEPDLTKWKGRESKAAGGNADGGAGDVTLESLKKIQADPKYWRDGDPALRKQVQDGYEKLYGKGKAVKK